MDERISMCTCFCLLSKRALDLLVIYSFCLNILLPFVCSSNLETTRQLRITEVLILCHILMYQFLVRVGFCSTQEAIFFHALLCM